MRSRPPRCLRPPTRSPPSPSLRRRRRTRQHPLPLPPRHPPHPPHPPRPARHPHPRPRCRRGATDPRRREADPASRSPRPSRRASRGSRAASTPRSAPAPPPRPPPPPPAAPAAPAAAGAAPAPAAPLPPRGDGSAPPRGGSGVSIPAPLAAREPWVAGGIHAALALGGAVVASAIVTLCSFLGLGLLLDDPAAMDAVSPHWFPFLIQSLGMGFGGAIGASGGIMGVSYTFSILLIPLLVPI